MTSFEKDKSRTPSSTRDVTQTRSHANQKWVCGLAELGCPCKTGPTARGLCSRLVSSEQANAKDLDLAGVDEQQGTERLLCSPVRSAYFSRHVYRVHLALFTACVLLVCLLIPNREKIFVPGELSKSHAQILQNTLVSDRCVLCHPNSHRPTWSAPLASFYVAAGQQDALCMNCHQEHLPQGRERLPHDVRPETLQAMSTARETMKLVSLGLPVSQEELRAPTARLTDVQRLTSCASCHIEHHGRDVDLKAISDRRCQSCHQEQFKSFSEGHPEFHDYPKATPRALAFSHATHEQKHFAQKSKSFECRHCHIDSQSTGGVGPVTRTKSFEQTCGECHSEPIRASLLEGWAIFSLPSVTSELVELDDFRNWPTNARYGFDGTITPVMRALLFADEQTRASIERLPQSGKIGDLPAFQQTEVGTAVALGTKRLLDDIAIQGQKAWRTRLETTLKLATAREITHSEARLLDRLSEGVAPDIFRRMKSEWFQAPELQSSESAPAKIAAPKDALDSLVGGDELLLGSSEDPSPSASKAVEADSGKAKIRGVEHLANGGLFLDGDTLSLRIMTKGHADPALTAWHEWQSIVGRSSLAVALGASSVATISPSTTAERHGMPGNCAQCHNLRITQGIRRSAAKSDDSARLVNWKPELAARGSKPFTKFNHAPHLSLPAISNCRYCHVSNSPSDNRTVVEPLSTDLAVSMSSMRMPRFVSTSSPEYHRTPRSSESDFHLLSKNQCNACHRPDGANQGCTQCHNYHVTELRIEEVGR